MFLGDVSGGSIIDGWPN